MNKMLSLPEPKSELIGTLLRVISEPQMGWEDVVLAAELIALDVRFDQWFLTKVKPQASSGEVERLLELSDEVTDRVATAWARWERSGGADDDGQLNVELKAGVRAFRDEIHATNGA